MPRYSVITQCTVCYTVVPRTVSKHVILPIKSISVCKQLFHMSSFSLWLRWNPFLWDWIPIITDKQTASGNFCYFLGQKECDYTYHTMIARVFYPLLFSIAFKPPVFYCEICRSKISMQMSDVFVMIW